MTTLFRNRRPSSLALAVCAAAVSAAAQPTASPSAASPYGVCSHVTRTGFGYRDESCARIAEAGIGAIRSDVDWQRCQPERDGPFDFSRYDEAIASCEVQGLRFLPILMRPPKWATPVWEHLDAWEAFVEAFVRRYGSRCPDVEIMNEPNLHVFWGAEPDAAKYACVLKAAYAAAKRADPSVRVLLGGLNGVPIPYLRTVLQCGGANAFDAICIHPYTHPYAPEPALERDIAALRGLLGEFGVADKPIIVSELGWPTHDANVEGLPLLRTLLAAARPEQAAWRCVYATASDAGGDIVAARVAAALPPGSTCEALSGDALRARLAKGDVDAVVYPFDETFPADTFDAVFDFVRDGGVLADLGGMPLWYPCTETAPGVFSRNPRGEDAEPLRRRLRLSLDAFWLDPATPREGRAFPTAAARAAGYRGDPAGERARRFQKPDRLGPDDEWIPVLTLPDSAPGGPRVAASVIRYGGDMKGCLAVSGVMGRNASVPIGEAAQANYLVRSLAICLALGVDGYYWYEFRSTETDPHYSEHHFGLTHADFSPKPALRAYMDFIAARPAGSVQRDVPLRDPETGVYRSEWTRPDGTVAGVFWKPGEIETPVFYEGSFPSVRAARVAFSSFDPLGWRPDGDAMESLSFGLALGDAPLSRSVEMRATVTPRSCDDSETGRVGIACWDIDGTGDYWHFSLIKGPDRAGARHGFLLEAYIGRELGVQSRFKRVAFEDAGAWEWNKPVELLLRVTPERVEGEAHDAATGALLHRCAYEPRPGSPIGPGAPALRVSGRFRARVENSEAGTSASVAARSANAPYRPIGPATGIRGEATGFFHVEAIDGRDWAIDPLGRAVVLQGVDHVSASGFHCEALGYSPYGRHVARNYPDLDAWRAETLDRLAGWGFTLLGAGGDAGLRHRSLAHVDCLYLSDRFTFGDEEWWISPNRHSPGTSFPNVYHPGYEKALEWACRVKVARHKNDPWLVGYFIDNELAWWGGQKKTGLGLFDLAMALPEGHTARQAAERIARENPDNPAVAFLRETARRYFAATAAAIRKADPNHMVLGCRFAGFSGHNDVIWEEAGKVCDIVSLNMYPWAQLDEGVVLDRRGGRPFAEHLAEVHALCGRPMMITEWSFPALDARPSTYGAGMRVETQAERAAATELCLKTLLSLPFVVGNDYFMWLDQPAEGISRLFPEDSNYGLVNEEGKPYEELTAMFRRVLSEAAALRTAGPSEGLSRASRRSGPAAPSGPLGPSSERERFFAEALRPRNGHVSGVAVLHPVGFRQDADGSWSLSNGLVRLSGRVGGRRLASEIAFADAGPVGSLGALLEWDRNGRPVWTDISRLAAVGDPVRDEPTGVVSVPLRGDGEAGKTRFAINARVSLAPGRGEALVELLSVENLGDAPVKVRGLFFRPWSNEKRPRSGRNVEKLYNAPAEGRWLLPDGSQWGVTTHDFEGLSAMRLWTSPEGVQHPDVAFRLPVPAVLASGETLTPGFPIGALLSLKLPPAKRTTLP